MTGECQIKTNPGLARSPFNSGSCCNREREYYKRTETLGIGESATAVGGGGGYSREHPVIIRSAKASRVRQKESSSYGGVKKASKNQGEEAG